MKYKGSFVALLLLLILLMTPMGRIEAKDKFLEEIADVEVNYGIKDYFRTDSVLLVTFKFKNVKKDFTGKLEIRYFSNNSASCSLSKELILFKGKDREKHFYPYLNSASPKFLMLILDEKGKVLWQKESNIGLFETDVSSDIVIGELDRAGNNFYFKGESSLNVKRKEIKTEDIPSDYMGLKLFDILIIPNGYLQGKNIREIKIIEERKRTGGLVIEEKDLETIDLYELLLLKEDRDDWMWRVEKVIGYLLTDLSVKGGKYILVLAIYILLVSPLTYYYLYKKRKRNWYYLTVPLLSLLFTMIMYAVGTDSRISGLQINYISVLDLRMNRSYENTIFAVTNSTNRSYDVTVTNGYKVEPAFGLHPTFSQVEALEGKIKRKVFEQKARTDITIGEGTAFETVFFRAEGNPDLHFGDMGKIIRVENRLVGEFKNKLGIDLQHVFGIYDDEVIYLGDVDQGKIRTINTDEDLVYLSDLTGNIADSHFSKEIFKDREDHDVLSKEMLLMMLINKLSVRNYEKPIFLAISKDKIGNEFAARIGAGAGYSVFLLSAESVSNSADTLFVNSINRLNYTIQDDEDSFLYNTFPRRTSIVVTYDLPKESFSKLSFFRRYNRLVSPFTVSVKNHETGLFEPIILPDPEYLIEIKNLARSFGTEVKDYSKGEDKVIEGLNRYIKNKKITVQYDISQAVYDGISNYFTFQMPKLSLE